MPSTQMFKVYNSYNNKIIKVKDAVKITSIPQYESFWVEVTAINYQTKEITGTVQNSLQRDHSFNYKDTINFKKNNIRDHKLEKDRFDVSKIDELFLQRLVDAIKNNNLTKENIESCINIRYLDIEE